MSLHTFANDATKRKIYYIMHADWSSDPRKRIACCAVLQDNGRYRLLAPQPVGELSMMLKNINSILGNLSCALIGFDFPIGLPLHYAEIAGIKEFLPVLPKFGSGIWSNFYIVAETPEEIEVRRPFYPKRPGGARQDHLVQGIGLKDINQLRRVCEKKISTRRSASPLFWTLGPQQVGKAAISGWQEVIAPGLVDKSLNLSIWPFSGELDDLLMANKIILVESYPAEYYTHFGITFGKGERSSKRDVVARRFNAPLLRDLTKEFMLDLDPSLAQQIDEGFNTSSYGDDGFDAFIGLMGMLNVVLGHRSPGEPDSDTLRNIEGWIFGQTYL